MTLQYDPEFKRLAGKALDFEDIPANDVQTRRERYDQLFKRSEIHLADGVEQVVHHVTASDKHQVAIYEFRKKPVTNTAPGCAVLHIHGGGYFSFSAADMAQPLSNYVAKTCVPMFSVDYRLSPESQYPVPLEDCWVALKWLYDHTEDFHIDPTRIAVMGESAGGGLAAGLVLLARDRKLLPPLAKQILIYPMIDDRTSEDYTKGQAVFGMNDVITGWTAYIGSDAGTEKVPIYAAAARNKNVNGLPRLYIDSPQIDIFLPENVEYARKHLAAGISTEFHVYEGVPHAFQRFAPEAEVVQAATANRVRALSNF